MTTGQKVKLLRLSKGWTQEELAIKIGKKSKTTISHIEKDRDCPLPIILNLAKIFDTSPAYLMGWERDPAKKLYLYKSLDYISDEQFETLISYFEELKTNNAPPVV